MILFYCTRGCLDEAATIEALEILTQCARDVVANPIRFRPVIYLLFASFVHLFENPLLAALSELRKNNREALVRASGMSS